MHLQTLGFIESPYAEKFSVPRQPGLVTGVKTELQLIPPFNQADYVDGLGQFSHLWLIFGFHHNTAAGWKPKVRPPRLGGNKKIGVFASRSSFRPNNLGMSVLKLETITLEGSPRLIFSGGDLVTGTPIYDIKPYIPYADALPDAQAGYAQQAPAAPLEVIWSKTASEQAANLQASNQQCHVIEQVLSQDPRPAYKKDQTDNKIYGVSLFNFNIRWQVGQQHRLQIIELCHAHS